MFDQIEKLKGEFTDKYVVVDTGRPELQRFANMTGTVRTVNMSGRALVEFEGGDNNIGWFDIDLDYLKVIDSPLPKPEVKKEQPSPEKKPVGEKPAGAPKPAAAEKPAAKKSTADILAAARGGSAKATDAPAAETKKPSTAEILAAARAKAAGGATAPPPAKVAPVPPVAADVVEWTVTEEQQAAVEEPVAAEPVVAVPVVTNPVIEEPAAPSLPAAKAPAGDLPQSTAAKIAWCRTHDSK